MITPYYQQQLAYLRELGALFSQKHPALVPLLAGQSSDPDVERLLEGSAFLSGLVQQRLDDDFPEIIHNLTDLIFPHYLNPLPAAAIVRFTPKPGLQEALEIPSGTELAAREIDGIHPIFTTGGPVNLLPLQIKSVTSFKHTLEIQLILNGMTWADIHQDRLRFYLAGDYNQAADVFSLLNQYLHQVHFSTEVQQITLNAQQGFDGLTLQDSFTLYPYPEHAFPALQPLQEYFQLPQKFLFFDILGLDQIKTPEAGLTITLVLTPEVEITQEQWQLELFCVPVVNLFHHHAESILLDHTLSEYRINPSGGAAYQIYAVDRVVGFQQGLAQERVYHPFALFNPQATHLPVYSVRRRQAQLDSGTEVYLSVAYPEQALEIQRETLVIQVRCTNSNLVEKICYGDIALPTESSPVMAEFSNITSLSAPVTAPLGDNLLWRLLSHLYLNQRTLACCEVLTALLKLYIFTNTSDRARVLANTKRVEAIKQLCSDHHDRMLYQGALIRGSHIKIQLDPDGFPCSGDLFLFGSILNRLLAAYSTINSYTRVTIENRHNKRSYQWPPLAGKRHLL